MASVAFVPPSPSLYATRTGRFENSVPMHSPLSDALHSKTRQEETLWLRADSSSAAPANAYLCDLHDGHWSLFAHQEVDIVEPRPQHRRHSSVPPKDRTQISFKHSSVGSIGFDTSAWARPDARSIGDGSSASFSGVFTAQTTPASPTQKRKHSSEFSGGNNEGSTPKRRRTSEHNSVDKERRFPCICHVGEPGRCPNDVLRHNHISGMCRHLKSHSIYVCGTCITLFASEEEMETHQHVRSCRTKGCKRQRPAFDPEPDPSRCEHMMTAEQQWLALFKLRYNREPPNLFETFSGAHVAPIQAEPDAPLVFDTCSDQLPTANGAQLERPGLDFNGLLGVESPQNFEAIPHISNASIYTPSDAANYQVLSMQTLVGTIQAQVAQLEQKLFQSSQREQQLEATLGVVFDAFQASGAPQAQPGRPLSKLVKSHASLASKAAHRHEIDQWQSGTHGTIPALALETAQFWQSFGSGKTGGSRTARSDSGYGSAQI